MSHLKFKHIEVELAPGGNPEVLKCELVALALKHHCDVHAYRQGGQHFYDVSYARLIAEGVPEL